jgi:hypothetical protein
MTMSAKAIQRHGGRSTCVGYECGAERQDAEQNVRRVYTCATSALAEVDGRVVARGVSLRLLVGGDNGGGKMQLPAGSKPRGQLGAGEGEGRSGQRRWGWWRVGGHRRVWGSSSIL